VIFLKINAAKLKIVFFVFMALTVGGLATAVYQANRQERLFLAIPKTSGISIAVNAAEDVNDRVVLLTYGQETERGTVSHVLLTYESRQSGSVKALQSRHDANLIGTNHSHPHVLNHKLIYGSFFSQEAIQHAQNVAVLNETAAFVMFGNIYAAGNELYIDNMKHRGLSVYRVLGVVDDGDEENINVYVPVTVLGSTVNAIAANFSVNHELSAEYIQTIWQQLGVTTDRYHLVNFYTLNIVVRDRLILIFFLLISGVLLGGISKTVKSIIKEWHAVNHLRREMYMIDLIKSAAFRRMASLVPCITGMTAAIGFIGLNAFERGLLAYDAHGMLNDAHTESFAVQFETMAYWYNISLLFFWCGVAVFLGLVILLWSKQGT
jgi:cytochrome c oxidase subunit IV